MSYATPIELKTITFKALDWFYLHSSFLKSNYLAVYVILVSVSRLRTFGKNVKTKPIHNERKIRMKGGKWGKKRGKKSSLELEMKHSSSFFFSSCETLVTLTTCWCLKCIPV